jgi:putative aldouronate transport system substrate-binding protein
MHQRVKPAPATRLQEIGEDVFRYFAEYTFDNAAFTNLGPAGGTDLAGTASQIATYWEEQLPKMVLADSADEARRIYEESVARIEEMGADEVLAAQNEKFQDNKAKLGVRHAWPPLRDE